MRYLFALVIVAILLFSACETNTVIVTASYGSHMPDDGRSGMPGNQDGGGVQDGGDDPHGG